MVLLALDTATKAMSLALHDGKTLLAEQMWTAGNQHNLLLASAIQASLQICEISTRDLTAIAVAIGPGSYTGLRIGVALAKGIASANHLPLVGVNTLDILAIPQPISTKNKLLCVVQAGRGRVIHATYTTKKGRWQLETEARIDAWEKVLADITSPTLISGEIDNDTHALLAEKKNDHITLLPPASRLRRAGVLAEEAHRRLRDGDAKDFTPTRANPIYLQAP
jgi:tRNA threonylcarbamoyladenosine biosynthesis protein TsaB